jgi:hypothetical protein
MLKIIAFSRITKFFWMYVRVDILLSCGKHFNDPIIPSGGEGRSLKLVIHSHILLMYLYHDRKFTGNVFVR